MCTVYTGAMVQSKHGKDSRGGSQEVTKVKQESAEPCQRAVR